VFDRITDAYALAAAISLGALAVLYGVAWRTLRSRWCIGFGASFLIAALIYALDRFTQPVGDHPNAWAVLPAMVAVAFQIEGAIDFLAFGQRFARALRAGLIGAALIVIVAMAAGALTRLAIATVFGFFLACIALRALWTVRREPRSGHGLVFASMLLIPGLVIAAWSGVVPVALMRYALSVPLVVTGMTVLTAGLVRARRAADGELQRAEQAEAAVRALNESLERRVEQRTAELHQLVIGLEGFNRHVSHDLRGPLGGIAGAAYVAGEALKRGDTELAARMLGAIGTSADSSVRLLAALLEFARVGDAPFTPRRVALEALVQDALRQLHRTDPSLDGIPVTVATPLPEVAADPDLLRQVYVNLVGNAVKFSRQGDAPKIEVGVVDRNGEPAFYVRDNGVGFDAGGAQKLFEPYQRLHGSRFPGYGIGLSVVKKIIQRHGGRVWAEASPGHGATFFFTLGRVEAA
jgi:signal transduction histidine kinase